MRYRHLAFLCAITAQSSLGAPALKKTPKSAPASSPTPALKSTPPATPSPSPAGKDDLSVGIQVGRFLNQGLTGQYLLAPNNAINGSIGMFLGTLTLGVDWIYFFLPKDAPLTSLTYASWRGRWIPYVGGGLQSGFFSGLRGVGGVQYGFPNHPLNAYFSLIVLPGADEYDDSILGGIIGIRYAIDNL